MLIPINSKGEVEKKKEQIKLKDYFHVFYSAAGLNIGYLNKQRADETANGAKV